MAHVGSHAEVPWLTDVLRQAGGSYAQSKLDELADSLFSRASDLRATSADAARYHLADAAVFALIVSGSRAGRGTPYAGALDRLIKIARVAPDARLRREVLAGLLCLPDRTRALAYMRDVAESGDATAADAVDKLIVDAAGDSWTGPKPTADQAKESAAVLHDLANRNRMSNPVAAHYVARWVSMHP